MNHYIYKKVGGEFFKGEILNIFIRIEPDNNTYSLTQLIVLENGTIICAECDISLEALKMALDSGRLTISIPQNAILFIPYIGRFNIEKPPFFGYENDSFLLIRNSASVT